MVIFSDSELSSLYGTSSYAQIARYISQGKIQVPLFTSSYTWGERELLNYLEYLQSGVQKISILLACTKIRIPSKRFPREIPEKPGRESTPFVKDVRYVLDGYHCLQSLYLAWYGFYMGKRVYFKINALNNEDRFYLLKSSKHISNIYKRLSDIQSSTNLSSSYIFDQMRENISDFHANFKNFIRCTVNVIDFDESHPDERTLRILDQMPDKRIIADRIRRFKVELMRASPKQESQNGPTPQ